MKKINDETELLLQASGELSARRLRKLKRQLAQSPELAKKAEEIERLTTLARSSNQETSIPDSTLNAILGEARMVAAEKRTSEKAPSPLTSFFRPAWAVPALILLSLAGWLMVKPPSPTVTTLAPPSTPLLAWEDNLDASFDELDLLFAMTDDEERDIDDLMDELLTLEATEI